MECGINRVDCHRAVVARFEDLAVYCEATVHLAGLNGWLHPPAIIQGRRLVDRPSRTASGMRAAMSEDCRSSPSLLSDTGLTGLYSNLSLPGVVSIGLSAAPVLDRS